MSSKLLAFKTNFAKQKKQRDRGEEVKPFNVQFRYYGQMSVINLRKKSKVLVDFVRCQKKKKKKKKKKNCIKKKNKKGKKEENEQNSKVHFFAKFTDPCLVVAVNGAEECAMKRKYKAVYVCVTKRVLQCVKRVRLSGQKIFQ